MHILDLGCTFHFGGRVTKLEECRWSVNGVYTPIGVYQKNDNVLGVYVSRILKSEECRWSVHSTQGVFWGVIGVYTPPGVYFMECMWSVHSLWSVLQSVVGVYLECTLQ